MSASIFKIMERSGTRFLRKFAERIPADSIQGHVHILNEEDRKEMRRIEHRAIFRAGLAGVASASIAGAVELYVRPLLGENGEAFEFNEQTMLYWLIVGSVLLITTAFEIAYIYYESLRGAFLLSRRAGLDIFSEENAETSISLSLARAALELPNPPEGTFRINHHNETPRWKLFFSTIIYKLKIMGTNILMKVLLRKILGRAGTKLWLEFIAIPVTALWNMWICKIVMREARVRALGPSMTLEFVDVFMAKNEAISAEAGQVMMQAVGSTMVSGADPHPNLIYLLTWLNRHFPVLEETTYDSTLAFLRELGSLEKNEQKWVVKILELAIIMDGRISKREIRLLQAAFKVCELKFNKADIEDMLDDFLHGRSIVEKL